MIVLLEAGLFLLLGFGFFSCLRLIFEMSAFAVTSLFRFVWNEEDEQELVGGLTSGDVLGVTSGSSAEADGKGNIGI